MPKQKKPKSRSIVWAIDPLESKDSHRTPLAKAVKVFSRGLSQAVMPFSVVSFNDRALPVQMKIPAEQGLRMLSKRAIEKHLKALHMPSTRPPEVTVHGNASRRDLVDDVLQYAKKKDAGFVAVNTRRLLSPFPFKVGGFAETLMGASDLPILAVSPKAKVSNHIKKILFPTDFSSRSHQAFRKTLELAKNFEAQVILLHVELPMEFPFVYSDMGFNWASSYISESEEERKKKNTLLAKKWLGEADASGVKCTFVADRKAVAIGASIISTARKMKADLISLAGYRSPKAPAVLGGIVRDVLSAANTPVLELNT